MNALIIGKNEIVKQAIGGLLENEFDFNIDYIDVTNPQLTYYEYQLQNVNFIILDLTTLDDQGRNIIKEIKLLAPDARIIAMHYYTQKNLVDAYIEAGAKGYLLIDTNRAELIKAMQYLLDGEVYISPGIN
ncbi:MAG TPA: response regulator [Bacteroidales bacterium]|nr:response regulator [Bacteroidales bacterium]